METEDESALPGGEQGGGVPGQQAPPPPPVHPPEPADQALLLESPSGQELTAAQKEGIRKEVEREPQKVVLRVEVRRQPTSKRAPLLGYSSVPPACPAETEHSLLGTVDCCKMHSLHTPTWKVSVRKCVHSPAGF